jgi:homoserine dehydrogenase
MGNGRVHQIRVGIAGLGTVGGGLLSLLKEDRRFARQGLEFTVCGVCARNRTRERAVSIADYPWFDDPIALATAAETDVFVELMGGSDGPARAAVTAALKAGKPVVTANKALIAEHGPELAALAESNGTTLKFEAAVAGGTPVVRGIRDGVAACRVASVAGILNGTCNFILSTMADRGAAFEDILFEAQREGFAEADPSFDIDGIDAAHKLSILTTLAFDTVVDFDDVSIDGIRQVTLDDIAAAAELGRAIKLVGEAQRTEAGIAMRVGPALVPADHPFAEAKGAGNAVTVTADPLGTLGFTGPGAGAGATAAAVAADLCTIGRGATGPVYAAAADRLERLPIIGGPEMENPFFVRLRVRDETGILARIAGALAEAGVSIASLQQPSVRDGFATLVIVTHPCAGAAVDRALAAIANAPFLDAPAARYPLINP